MSDLVQALRKRLEFDVEARSIDPNLTDFELELLESEYKRLAPLHFVLLGVVEAAEFYAQQTDLYGERISQYNSDYENYGILADKGERARLALAALREAVGEK